MSLILSSSIQRSKRNTNMESQTLKIDYNGLNSRLRKEEEEIRLILQIDFVLMIEIFTVVLIECCVR